MSDNLNENNQNHINDSSLPQDPSPVSDNTPAPQTEDTASSQQASAENTQQAQPQQQAPNVPQNSSPGYSAPNSNNYTYGTYTGPQNNSTYAHTYASYNTPPIPPKTPKKPKKSGVPAGAVAVLCICMLLLSGAVGFVGAYLATTMFVPEPTETVTPSTDEKEPSVIYNSAASPTSGMSADSGTSAYYNVASLVKDSVVEITTEFVVSSYFQYVSSGAGSGVILTQDGYIITNNHVIVSSDTNQTADTITVRLTDGREYTAVVIGRDADSDIAVIKIEPEEPLTCVVLGDSSKLAVGEEVIAVGNPLGELGGTVTNGIISALDREVTVDSMVMNLLQTNAAINPGNSGGGLFNMAGELIGIVNAKSSGTGIEGLGFAIPINDAVSIAEQLINQGYVSGKPWLGIEFYDVTTYQQALYLHVNSLGVYVYGLLEGYNDTVFELGDRIIAMNGKEIASTSDIKAQLKTISVGDSILFNVYRNGKLIEVTATCYEYTPDVQFNQE